MIHERERLPAALIMEHVEARLAEWNVAAQISPMIEKTQFVQDMADMLGVGVRALHRWRSGESKTMKFVVADQMMCRLDMAQAWYTAPLREHYDRCNARTCRQGHDLVEFEREGSLVTQTQCPACKAANRLRWQRNGAARAKLNWKTTEQLIAERIAA